jgi:hypothetical protein
MAPDAWRMEERMIELGPITPPGAPRRNLFARLAGAAAVGLAGLLPTPSSGQSATAGADGPNWPGTLQGRHRQVVDAYNVSSGHPLVFAHTFLATNPPGLATSVIVLRAEALPIALNSAMWEKYKIGESLKIMDPETKAPAVKNPFLHPKPGVLQVDDSAIDRLLGEGAVVGACNVALRGQSRRLAGNAGVGADQAAKEWAENVVAGVTIIPSGVWGLNRAQEAGCTYCAGG